MDLGGIRSIPTDHTYGEGDVRVRAEHCVREQPDCRLILLLQLRQCGTVLGGAFQVAIHRCGQRCGFWASHIMFQRTFVRYISWQRLKTHAGQQGPRHVICNPSLRSCLSRFMLDVFAPKIKISSTDRATVSLLSWCMNTLQSAASGTKPRFFRKMAIVQ